MNAPLPEHLLPEIRQRETPTALLGALKARFAERCSTALVVREQHGRDGTRDGDRQLDPNRVPAPRLHRTATSHTRPRGPRESR